MPQQVQAHCNSFDMGSTESVSEGLRQFRLPEPQFLFRNFFKTPFNIHNLIFSMGQSLFNHYQPQKHHARTPRGSENTDLKPAQVGG